MLAPKRAREDESAGAAPGWVGGAPPPPPPPPERRRPATRSVVAAEAYERRLKLTDIIGFVALNGYAREADACAGLNRETWRCIPAGLSAADADRVRRDHPLGRPLSTFSTKRSSKRACAGRRAVVTWRAYASCATGARTSRRQTATTSRLYITQATMATMKLCASSFAMAPM
jgi:hypothetical protein